MKYRYFVLALIGAASVGLATAKVEARPYRSWDAYWDRAQARAENNYWNEQVEQELREQRLDRIIRNSSTGNATEDAEVKRRVCENLRGTGICGD